MIFKESIEEFKNLIDNLNKIDNEVYSFYKMIEKTLKSKKTIYICGNGGSASDGQHFAAELVGRFETKRGGYPAICLNTDTSNITAISNDYGFESVFARQVESICIEGDLLIGITTSGNSKNIIKAVEVAIKKNISTIALTGKGGGKIKNIVDLSIIVPSQRTCRIQEAHIFILHFICELIDHNTI